MQNQESAYSSYSLCAVHLNAAFLKFNHISTAETERKRKLRDNSKQFLKWFKSSARSKWSCKPQISPDPEVSFKMLSKHSLAQLCPQHRIKVTVTAASSDLLPRSDQTVPRTIHTAKACSFHSSEEEEKSRRFLYTNKQKTPTTPATLSATRSGLSPSIYTLLHTGRV